MNHAAARRLLNATLLTSGAYELAQKCWIGPEAIRFHYIPEDEYAYAIGSTSPEKPATILLGRSLATSRIVNDPKAFCALILHEVGHLIEVRTVPQKLGSHAFLSGISKDENLADDFVRNLGFEPDLLRAIELTDDKDDELARRHKRLRAMKSAPSNQQPASADCEGASTRRVLTTSPRTLHSYTAEVMEQHRTQDVVLLCQKLAACLHAYQAGLVRIDPLLRRLRSSRAEVFADIARELLATGVRDTGDVLTPKDIRYHFGRSLYAAVLSFEKNVRGIDTVLRKHVPDHIDAAWGDLGDRLQVHLHQTRGAVNRK